MKRSIEQFSSVLIKFLSLFLIPFVCYSGWEVASPQAAYPHEPFFQAGTQPGSMPLPADTNSSVPNQYADLGQPAALYAVSISGSLKENIERIMGRYHWRVIWKSGNDYNFDGRVTGSSLPNVIEKLLNPFPLQATMYMANRTLVVTPRASYRV